MTRITACLLPPESLLAERLVAGDYGDCYTADVAGHVTLEHYVRAFYSSLTFRPERILLGLIGRGANAADVEALATGAAQSFAAWSVEARTDDAILLRDFLGQTRSWLKVEPDPTGQTTRLSFGSGVGRSPESGESSTIGRAIFAALMPFHRLYARVLLWGAVRQLARAS